MGKCSYKRESSSAVWVPAVSRSSSMSPKKIRVRWSFPGRSQPTRICENCDCNSLMYMLTRDLAASEISIAIKIRLTGILHQILTIARILNKYEDPQDNLPSVGGRHYWYMRILLLDL